MQTVSTLQKQKAESASAPDFTPILFREIELDQPLPTLSAFDQQKGRTYHSMRCLVRLHSVPLGLIAFSLEGELSPSVYARSIWRELGERINAHLREDGLPAIEGLDGAGLPSLPAPRCAQEREAFLQTAPLASVVLSTRDRPDRLAHCLPALLGQHYPSYEVIVVDNASSTSATAEFLQQKYAGEPRLRYVREDHPGLSAGRNRGIKEARGEIVAFTDDDVLVDSYWLAGLVRGFSSAENVACVTGLVLPLELETQAQLWFEEFGGFGKGFTRRIFTPDTGRQSPKIPLYPFTSGQFGTGASMAFSAKFLQKEQGFDPALGAGSLTGGGEDLVAFLRVILRGNSLVYEPASLAYHGHRREYSSLQRQMYAYGTGLTAYLTKIVIDNPLLLFKIGRRVPSGLFLILSARSTKNKGKSFAFPKELTSLERKGMLHGPLLYLKGRFTKRNDA